MAICKSLSDELDRIHSTRVIRPGENMVMVSIGDYCTLHRAAKEGALALSGQHKRPEPATHDDIATLSLKDGDALVYRDGALHLLKVRP